MRDFRWFSAKPLSEPKGDLLLIGPVRAKIESNVSMLIKKNEFKYFGYKIVDIFSASINSWMVNVYRAITFNQRYIKPIYLNSTSHPDMDKQYQSNS